MILNRLGLIISSPLLAATVFGSTVAQQGAVLLHEQNYSETIGLRDADSPIVRQFYVAAANSPRWDSINRKASNISVAPFRTPLPGDKRAGPFILDTTAPDRSEFASRILELHTDAIDTEQGLYLGLAAANDDPKVATPVLPEFAIGTLDKPMAGSTLAFVRFDINEWEVSEGVLSYDIDISYWGKPAIDAAATDKTLMAMGEAL
jgi:hypothetical protein